MTYEELGKLIKPIEWDDTGWEGFIWVIGKLGRYSYEIVNYDNLGDKLKSLSMIWQDDDGMELETEDVDSVEEGKALARKWMLKDILENMFM